LTLATARSTPISGLTVLERTLVHDDRGFFDRLISVDDAPEIFEQRTIYQVNRTLTTRRGTIRGLHFQVPPVSDLKIVTCVRGRVLDVAVDLRRTSPTFLAWHAELLDSASSLSIVIPEGFAHGFQTLEDECELVYIHTGPYRPAAEGGFSSLDPRLAIPWPEVITSMSERDRHLPNVPDDFDGIPV
jgi:dTDP-4-dehydrorhamnose 3,5-epimerase